MRKISNNNFVKKEKTENVFADLVCPSQSIQNGDSVDPNPVDDKIQNRGFKSTSA